jgi:hypothetical protein
MRKITVSAVVRSCGLELVTVAQGIEIDVRSVIEN